jgi:CRISPR-associated endonuclease Csy4
VEHYIEILILPDPEFSESMLMNAIFSKLHRALTDVGNGQVGVSFPKAKKTLGGTLRLHGNQADLERLMSVKWLKGLSDYLKTSEILPVPVPCKYRCIKRIQAKSSAERLYRRSVKKGWMTVEEARAKIVTVEDRKLKNPFLNLKSNSSGQKFQLFVEQCELLDQPQCDGCFSNYGFSDKKTIPWF